MENLDKWIEAYTKHLTNVVSDPKFADQYFYGVDRVPSVVSKMRIAFEDGSYNIDGVAIARTCREFKISHTRKAINRFLRGE